jgi:succinyl-CoA synthetase alpha subunit
LAILIDEHTRLLVQGITGREGEFHALKMLEYGTRIVAGVTPGKGGQKACGERVPVFDTVAEAVLATGANTSILYVPARFAAEAILEASEAGIELVVCVTEGIPVLDMVRVCAYMKLQGTRLVGPNCPGIISPGRCSVGIIPGSITTPGTVGIVSRSGTLTYEVIQALTQHGYGQSTCVGIGGDPLVGMGFVDILQLFEQDEATKQIVLIGEIGGNEEQTAAKYISEQLTKPVTAFIAGKTAPRDKRMGHAGAIIEGGSGSAADKIAAFVSHGIPVAEHPEQVAELVATYHDGRQFQSPTSAEYVRTR